MKNTNVIVLAGGLAAMVTAQEINECARQCLNNMEGLAEELGCGGLVGDEVHRCLCSKADYAYGIRDCSLESCSDEVGELAKYAKADCSGRGINWDTVTVADGGSGTPQSSEAVTGAESDRAPETVTSGIADVTSAIDSVTVSGIIATITSDGQVHTTLIPVEDASSDVEAPTQTGSETSPTGTAEGDEPSESANPSASGAEVEGDDSPAMHIVVPAVGFVVAAGIAAILL